MGNIYEKQSKIVENIIITAENLDDHRTNKKIGENLYRKGKELA